MDVSAPVDPELLAFATTHQLVRPGETTLWRRLTGGVSSDVWHLISGGRSVCIKRALGRLHVTADWRAPTARSLYEWRWFQTAAGVVPGSVPEPVAFDQALGILAMGFLEPDHYPLWKGQLMAGHVDPQTAAQVGDRIGSIHAATAGDAAIAKRFETDEIFYALRIEPFLVTPADRHPQLAPALRALASRTGATKLALVHGDVSPKNILVGADGPVFLDAETAWYGDPAFDLAFCTMHLMLKHLAVPAQIPALSESISALRGAYLAQVSWETVGALETRAAYLVPALMLARVDGKSPVEYLPQTAQKDLVRAFATTMLLDQKSQLNLVHRAWVDAINQANLAFKGV